MKKILLAIVTEIYWSIIGVIISIQFLFDKLYYESRLRSTHIAWPSIKLSLLNSIVVSSFQGNKYNYLFSKFTVFYTTHKSFYSYIVFSQYVKFCFFNFRCYSLEWLECMSLVELLSLSISSGSRKDGVLANLITSAIRINGGMCLLF